MDTKRPGPSHTLSVAIAALGLPLVDLLASMDATGRGFTSRHGSDVDCNLIQLLASSPPPPPPPPPAAMPTARALGV